MPHYVAFHLDIHCCHCLGVLVFKGVGANKKGIVDVKFSLYSVFVEATFLLKAVEDTFSPKPVLNQRTIRPYLS